VDIVGKEIGTKKPKKAKSIRQRKHQMVITTKRRITVNDVVNSNCLVRSENGFSHRKRLKLSFG
jgi:hypothetical protein